MTYYTRAPPAGGRAAAHAEPVGGPGPRTRRAAVTAGRSRPPRRAPAPLPRARRPGGGGSPGRRCPRAARTVVRLWSGSAAGRPPDGRRDRVFAVVEAPATSRPTRTASRRCTSPVPGQPGRPDDAGLPGTRWYRGRVPSGTPAGSCSDRGDLGAARRPGGCCAVRRTRRSEFVLTGPVGAGFLSGQRSAIVATSGSRRRRRRDRAATGRREPRAPCSSASGWPGRRAFAGAAAVSASWSHPSPHHRLRRDGARSGVPGPGGRQQRRRPGGRAGSPPTAGWTNSTPSESRAGRRWPCWSWPRSSSRRPRPGCAACATPAGPCWPSATARARPATGCWAGPPRSPGAPPGACWPGWTAGIGHTLVMGLLVKTVMDFIADDPSYRETLAAIGWNVDQVVLSFVGMMGTLVGMLVSLHACWRIGAARAEESSGRLDAVLTRPVTRSRWLGGHLALTLAGAVCHHLCRRPADVDGFPPVGLRHPPADVLGAALNSLPVTVFFTGLAVLVYALAPRVAACSPPPWSSPPTWRRRSVPAWTGRSRCCGSRPSTIWRSSPPSPSRRSPRVSSPCSDSPWRAGAVRLRAARPGRD